MRALSTMPVIPQRKVKNIADKTIVRAGSIPESVVIMLRLLQGRACVRVMAVILQNPEKVEQGQSSQDIDIEGICGVSEFSEDLADVD